MYFIYYHRPRLCWVFIPAPSLSVALVVVYGLTVVTSLVAECGL